MAHKGGSIVPVEAVVEVRRLYEERDGRGRRLHSHRSLGKMFGLSETTVLRIVNGQGAFMAWQPEKPQAEIQAAAMASFARVQAALDVPPTDAQKRMEADIVKHLSKTGNPEVQPVSNTHGAGNSADAPNGGSDDTNPRTDRGS
jgi:hypothetical protein